MKQVLKLLVLMLLILPMASCTSCGGGGGSTPATGKFQLDPTFGGIGYVTKNVGAVELGAGLGVAVDSSGNVYAAGQNLLCKYNNTGVLVSTFGTDGCLTFSTACEGPIPGCVPVMSKLVLDSAGDYLYVVGENTAADRMLVLKYSSSGTFQVFYQDNNAGTASSGKAIALSNAGTTVFATGYIDNKMAV